MDNNNGAPREQFTSSEVREFLDQAITGHLEVMRDDEDVSLVELARAVLIASQVRESWRS